METVSLTKLSELKLSIRKQVLQRFLDGNTHEINEISTGIGVSRQTVMKCINFYVNTRLVEAVGKGVSGSSGGKKPVLYALSASLYLICVTLWDRNFRISLYSLNGKLIDRISLDIPLPGSGEAAAENIGRLSGFLLEKNGIAPSEVRGVSVSVHGTVDRNTNTLISSIPARHWGTQVPLGDYLKPYFPAGTLIFVESPEKIHSGVNIADDRFANKRTVYITIDHRVDGCLVDGKTILNGAHSMIGKIGHIVVDPSDPEECFCGAHGCLEVMVSPLRLQQIIRNSAEQYPDSILLQCADLPVYQDIFDAASAGDPLGKYCEEYLAKNIAIALKNIAVTFDPDCVVFNGSGFRGSESFIRMLYSHLHFNGLCPGISRPFEIFFDHSDLVERDAICSMQALRWQLLNSTDICLDMEQDSRN